MGARQQQSCSFLDGTGHENIFPHIVTLDVGNLQMKRYHSWMVNCVTNIAWYFTTPDKRALRLCVFISEKVLSKSRGVYTDSCFLYKTPTHAHTHTLRRINRKTGSAGRPLCSRTGKVTESSYLHIKHKEVEGDTWWEIDVCFIWEVG